MSEKEISLKSVKDERKDYLGSEKNAVIRHALNKAALDDALFSKDACANHAFTFSLDHKTLKATNQLHSGRCWIFSGLNLLREIVAKKAGIKDVFEISQNYISFYDKLEKINYVLEKCIFLIDEKPDDRKLMFLLSNGIGDGGQWTMFTDIVKKYGICPKAAYAETAQSNETRLSNNLINSWIRHFACQIKAVNKKGGMEQVYALKDEYMKKFYALLCDCYGVPPEKFDFEYVDKEGKYHVEPDCTPKGFFDKYIGEEIDEYVSVINAPTSDKEFNKTYQIELLGNVIGGKDVTHLNVSMERMKEMIVSQLEDGELVWFGSDVGKFGDRVGGVWDDKSFDYVSAFGMDLGFEKKDMLDYHDSAMNHAMLITGFDKVGNKITRWKIENSWGGDRGENGNFIMSASFFDRFVYQAAIKAKYLNKEEKAALLSKPVLLPPWDPFGTLAD